MRKLSLLLSPLFLFADISLQELQDAPEGRVRNFNIWQYMQQDISAKDAQCAYELTKGYNHKIFIKYAKKTDDEKILEQSRCSNMKTPSLLSEDNASCINHGLSLSRAMNLSAKQRSKLSQELKVDYSNKSELILLMNDKSFVLSTLKSGEKNYLKLFNSLGAKNRQQYFNVKLPAERMNALAQHKAFNKSIKYIVTDNNMHRMQESLLLLQGCDMTSESYFFLALNALRFKATTKANYYLEIAQKKAYYQIHKDKAVFWKYLISKDENYLRDLILLRKRKKKKSK